MSRSSWKPVFFPIELTASLSSSSPQEIVATQRATPILSERIGHRFHVRNGRRLFPVTITAERVGHCLGEFAPTRKRPVPPAAKLAQIKSKKATSKKLNLFLFSFFYMGQKIPSVALRLGLHRKWSTSWFSVEFGSSGATPSISSASLTTASVFNSTSSTFTRPAPNVVPRGGQLRSGREERVFSLFCRRPFVFSSTGRSSFTSSTSPFPRLASSLSALSVNSDLGEFSSDTTRLWPAARRRNSSLSSTPLSTPHRFYPIDLHIRVGPGGQLFIFFLYSKLLGRAKGAL